MKKVVLLGGGTGLSNLIEAIKDLQFDISVGVAISDNGGSTGKIREYYDIPAPGDIRKVMNSFIDNPSLKEIFEYRFDDKLESHTVGNLLLTALVDIKGDMTKAVEQYCEMFEIKAKIYPLSNTSAQLSAKMKDYKIIEGEDQITKYERKIKKVFYKDTIKPNENLLKKIEEADFIILSAGSLYTSLLPNLIIDDVIKSFKKSNAKVIYIANIMTQKGETEGYTVSRHLKAIENHAYKNLVDILIANDYYDISPEMKEKYLKEESRLVKLDEDNLHNIELYKKKLIKEEDYIRHDVVEVSKILTQIIKE